MEMDGETDGWMDERTGDGRMNGIFVYPSI